MSSSTRLCAHRVDLSVKPTAGTAAVLMKSDTLKVTRVHVAKDEARPTFVTGGDVLIECRQGHAMVTTDSEEFDLPPDTLLHLPPGVPHALRAAEDSVVLIVSFSDSDRPAAPIVLACDDSELTTEEQTRDSVQEASEESFPASDAPSWTPTSAS